MEKEGSEAVGQRLVQRLRGLPTGATVHLREVYDRRMRRIWVSWEAVTKSFEIPSDLYIGEPPLSSFPLLTHLKVPFLSPPANPSPGPFVFFVSGEPPAASKGSRRLLYELQVLRHPLLSSGWRFSFLSFSRPWLWLRWWRQWSPA